MKKIGSLLVISLFTLSAFAQSGAERDFAIKYLMATQQEIVNSAQDLSDEAWNYTPEAGGWSASNCLEHILVTEQAFFGMIQGMLQGEADESLDMSGADGVLIGTIANRGTKVTTAPQFEPSGKWDTKDDMLNALKESRTQIIDFLKSNDANMRHHKGEIPLGEVDAYQIVLLIAGHSQRHTHQMKEVLGEYQAM
ncbi:MAG: hypothetical protein ED557_13795 [Balneola sp.]|nr:MAG: hypothetical protein ED557_13795 [Balneola sp.]